MKSTESNEAIKILMDFTLNYRFSATKVSLIVATHVKFQPEDTIQVRTWHITNSKLEYHYRTQVNANSKSDIF